MNRKINLAGDVMTIPQMKAAYQKVTGKKPKRWRLPAALFRRLVPEFAAQLAWHNEVNFAFDAAALRAARPEATTFPAFLKRHDIQTM